ncbi:hypothetical protein [Mycolicibacterium confluentis]|uniref:hypothetical protein n=1 Tax=Mycolicibacterium confluentis TaxID=28047 RepID=UPI000A14D153|nr:hypothetical protein [Mycolicibacterium confluentis]MCV7319596.1 hypothetical protein [Mycolicibacterium confluentis]ORV34848.1 hypothetical protein AWB99_00745 [Mycolicibacterium confluentis]
MNPLLHRFCLTVLALTGVVVGVWAYFAPLHWYNTFPGFGLQWLPVLGPYNEHFAKDVGAMYLGTAALAAMAFAYLGNRALMRATALMLSIFNLLHLVYHVPMLHMYGPLDATLNVISLTAILACSLATALPVKTHTSRERSTAPARTG